MITVNTFVGTLLEEITRARAASDKASARLAEQYLEVELLKGFPVPRMQIRDINLELNFAVASKQQGASFLEDEEVQRNIVHQMRDFVDGLPSRKEFTAYFGKDEQLIAKWNSGIDGLTKRFAEILSKPAMDQLVVINSLSLCVQNYFYESAPDRLRSQVSTILARPLKIKTDSEAGSIKAIIEPEIGAIVTATDKRKTDVEPQGPSDLNVLLGASELEKLNPALLHKVKINISASDRRWVITEQDGKKVAILDRG